MPFTVGRHYSWNTPILGVFGAQTGQFNRINVSRRLWNKFTCISVTENDPLGPKFLIQNVFLQISAKFWSYFTAILSTSETAKMLILSIPQWTYVVSYSEIWPRKCYKLSEHLEIDKCAQFEKSYDFFSDICCGLQVCSNSVSVQMPYLHR